MLDTLRHINGFYIAVALLFIANAALSPSFLTAFNLEVILTSSAALLLVASGVTIVILTGRIDISVGSTMFLCGGLFVALQDHGLAVVPSTALALAAAMLIGAVNGALVAWAGLSALLTTLGMMLVVRGLGLNVIGGQQLNLPESAVALRQASIAGIPTYALVALIVAALAHIVVSRSRMGRRLVAVGCSDQSAAKLGIPVPRYVFSAHVVAAGLAGLGGIVAVLNLGGVQTYLGKGQEFVAIAAVVVGGTSLFGGRGAILPGTLVGVLFLVTIENGLNLAGVSPFAFPFVTGTVILVAMYAYSVSNGNSR